MRGPQGLDVALPEPLGFPSCTRVVTYLHVCVRESWHSRLPVRQWWVCMTGWIELSNSTTLGET